MPSLFEPCGLNQLYSLAHGTVPIVRATGGLADTVVDLNSETCGRTATGFAFAEPTGAALWASIGSVGRLVGEPWGRLVRNGMQADWSWARSAKEYVDFTRRLPAAYRSANRSANGCRPVPASSS